MNMRPIPYVVPEPGIPPQIAEFARAVYERLQVEPAGDLGFTDRQQQEIDKLERIVSETSRQVVNTANQAETTARIIEQAASTFGGRSLGPEPNTFSAPTRSEAEALRDAQGDSDPDWLQSYNSNGGAHILLQYNEGRLAVYQHRVKTYCDSQITTFEWQDNGGPQVTAIALRELLTRITVNGNSIDALSQETTDLRVRIDGIADATAFNQLSARVTQNGQDIVALSQEITRLTAGTGGLIPGPPQNRFRGVLRTGAEKVRDAYDLDTDGWIEQYDAAPNFYIVLETEI